MLPRELFILLYFAASVSFVAEAQLVTEIYQSMSSDPFCRFVYETMSNICLTACTAPEGELAKCGTNANCFIIDNLPTCHCAMDAATGLPLAGNPYRACTWDISGTWQLYSFQLEKSGFTRQILSPVSNEPFVIRLDRTDAILKTKYMTGAIFIVTALTGFSVLVAIPTSVI